MPHVASATFNFLLQPTYVWYTLPSSLKRPAVSRSSILTLYNVTNGSHLLGRLISWR